MCGSGLLIGAERVIVKVDFMIKILLMLNIPPGFSIQTKQNIRHGGAAWAGWEESIVA